MNGFTPGGIRSPEAYAQSKMLDHSSWFGLMRGNITPSDIDMVVESYGCFLFCELSREKETLPELSRGQRIMLTEASRLRGTHCVAILTHGLLSHSKPIDTANDIRSACVYFDSGAKMAYLSGDEWRDFAAHWTFDPAGAVKDGLRPKEATHGR